MSLSITMKLNSTPLKFFFSEDGPTRESFARICLLWNTSISRQSSLKFTCQSLQADTKKEASRKLTAQLWKDSQILWWWRAETVVKNNWQSELSNRLWKSSPWLPERIHCKCSSTPSLLVVPEKTPPESEPVVLSEDKPLTSPHWEE